jgi:hypothetical protein
VSNALGPRSQSSTIAPVSRSITGPKLFPSGALESGKPSGHLVSLKKYLFLRKVKAVILDSQIGFSVNTSNAPIRR